MIKDKYMIIKKISNIIFKLPIILILIYIIIEMLIYVKVGKTDGHTLARQHDYYMSIFPYSLGIISLLISLLIYALIIVAGIINQFIVFYRIVKIKYRDQFKNKKSLFKYYKEDLSVKLIKSILNYQNIIITILYVIIYYLYKYYLQNKLFDYFTIEFVPNI